MLQNELDMSFNYEPVYYGQIKDNKGRKTTEKTLLLLNECTPKEKKLDKAFKRLYGRESWFNHVVIHDDAVMSTIGAAHGIIWDYANKTSVSCMDIIHAQTFPEDYNFESESLCSIAYVCGMSVPPVMMKRVVNRLIESGVFNYKETKGNNSND